MDALAKMTILPARRLESASAQFRRKGRLSPGADADIVIFDPVKIADRSTVEHPETPAEGMDWVLVNGVAVKSPSGFDRAAHPGQPLRGDPASRLSGAKSEGASLAAARP